MSKPAKTLLQTFAGDLASEKVDNVRLLYLDDIRPFGHQARRSFDDAALHSLAESIKAHGLQEPIIVRYNHDGRTAYELIAGERRWRACRIAGVDPVPSVLRDLDDTAALEIHLLENLQRADLNPIEEARGYRSYLVETGGTQAALGKLVGKSQSAIANALRLLELPEGVQAPIISGEMSAYHGRLLLSLKPGTEQQKTWINSTKLSHSYVSGAELPALAPSLTATQLETAVKELNARAAAADRTAREEERDRKKAEETAEKLRAEKGGDVRAEASPYRMPDDVFSIPAVSTCKGEVHHERCRQACPHLVHVARSSGSVEACCGDAACRDEVVADLKARVEAEKAERARKTQSYRKAAGLGLSLSPADQRRLALYMTRAQIGVYQDEANRARIWCQIPAEVTEEDVISALVEMAIKKAVAAYDSDWGVPDHAAVRVWLAEAFGIPRGWILGTQGKEVNRILAEAAEKAGKGGNAA